jgi:hypothetical protein
MGDRTSVTLTVLLEHKDRARSILDAKDGTPDEENEYEELCCLNYEEVNYGVLDGLRQFIKEGIPYSVQSEAGSSYAESEEHLRYLEDGSFELKNSEKDWPENTIHSCIEAVKVAQANGTADIVAVLTSLLDIASTPSWDNQAVLSKQYLATQLINPQQ